MHSICNFRIWCSLEKFGMDPHTDTDPHTDPDLHTDTDTDTDPDPDPHTDPILCMESARGVLNSIRQ